VDAAAAGRIQLVTNRTASKLRRARASNCATVAGRAHSVDRNNVSAHLSPPMLLLAALLAGLGLPAQAQPAPYKVIAPDGSVTYTDRPPATEGARVLRIGRDGSVQATSTELLDPALRKTMQRYPVTLYAAPDCAPCDAGRQLLHQRGVPYTEKRVVTDDDAAELERIVGARTVPTLTIGAQALPGLAAAEWSAYLDAAGYARESQLPRNWQPKAATPTAARSASPAAAPAPAQPDPAAGKAPPPATAPEPLGPGLPGIRF
jgi:glutaredoxin